MTKLDKMLTHVSGENRLNYHVSSALQISRSHLHCPVALIILCH